MTGRKYRELRNCVNKDIQREKNLRQYKVLKIYLAEHVSNFMLGDNLCELAELMRIGTKILEREGFPIKEFIKYKNG